MTKNIERDFTDAGKTQRKVPLLGTVPTATSQLSALLGRLLKPEETPLVMQPARFIECEADLTDSRFADEDEHAGENTAADRKAALEPAQSEEEWQRRINELLDGSSYYGWSGCEALKLRKALEVPTTNILVTNQRILVVDVNKVDDPHIEWEHDRDRMPGIWKAARFMEPGRVVMVLHDGSVLVMHVGMLGGKRAQSVVSACEHCE